MKQRSSRSTPNGKRRRSTRKSPTSHQQTPRAIVSTVACAWRSLEPACRPTWQTLARLLPARPHHYVLFNQVNATLLTLGHPLLETDPELPSFGYLTPGPFTARHASAPPRSLRLSLPPANTRPPDDYLYEATRPLSAGISNPGSASRLLGSSAGLSPWSPTQLTQAYLQRFADPPDGEALWLRVTPVISGLRGVGFTLTAIVGGAPPPAA